MLNTIMKYQFSEIQEFYYPHCSETQLDISLIDSPVNYKLFVIHRVLPLYVKTYSIIRNELLNPVLNIDLTDRIKTNQSIYELQSSVTTSYITLLTNIMIISLDAASIESNRPQIIFRHHNFESVIRSHKKCLATLEAVLPEVREQAVSTEISKKTKDVLLSKQVRLYNESKTNYSACWFFCSKLKDTMDTQQKRLSVVQCEVDRATKEVYKVTREVTYLEQTLDRHHQEIGFVQTRLSLHHSQNRTFTYMMNSFQQILEQLPNTSLSSNSSDKIFQHLYHVPSVIIQLNTIYHILQRAYSVTSFVEPLISNNDMQQFKLQLTQLQSTLKSFQNKTQDSSSKNSSTLLPHYIDEDDISIDASIKQSINNAESIISIPQIDDHLNTEYDSNKEQTIISSTVSAAAAESEHSADSNLSDDTTVPILETDISSYVDENIYQGEEMVSSTIIIETFDINEHSVIRKNAVECSSVPICDDDVCDCECNCELSHKRKDTAPNGCGPENWRVSFIIDKVGSYFEFTAACQKHDKCYGRCTNSRVSCNEAFYSDMVSSCAKNWSVGILRILVCEPMAFVFNKFVESLGKDVFVRAQKRNCKCISERGGYDVNSNSKHLQNSSQKRKLKKTCINPKG